MKSITTKHLYRARLALSQHNAVPYYHDTEHYVTTWKTSYPINLCRDIKISCRDITVENFVVISNALS